MNNNKTKKGSDLKECFGLINKDKEREETSGGLKRVWKKWSKRYV